MLAGIMSTTTWTRTQWGPLAWNTVQNNVGLVSLPAGQTIMRVRFAWGFGGTTTSSVVIPQIMSVPMVFGLVTTIGNGTEAKPDVISAPGDANPPSQRWIWHERRWPNVTAFDSGAMAVIWESSQPQEPCDSHGQVLAPSGMGVGNTLNLNACFRAATAWDTSGVAEVYGFANVLVRVP